MSTYKFAATGKDRKHLAAAIGTLLETKPKYLYAPTLGYEIGAYTLSKDSVLEGPDLFGLLSALAEQGFVAEPIQAENLADETPEPEAPQFAVCARFSTEAKAEGLDEPEEEPAPEPSRTFHLITPRGTLLCQKRYDTREEAEADGYNEYFHHEGRDVYIKQNPDGATEHSKLFAVVGEPFEKPAPEPESAVDGVCIEYPRAGMTDETIENLRRMVAAKAPLIKMALGVDELPIEVLPDRLAFDWFSTQNDNGQIDCWAQFIACLCRTAAAKKRVTAQEREFVNPRYQMRCFCLSLGMIGNEYAATRRLLIAPLSGNSGWLVPPEKAQAAAPAACEATPEESEEAHD
jgi:hypothetical protein